ncbi:unnamed protein product [Nezara viridula]|uniref:Uncharacterized protein n=1 Tax=Nezara viridula TaxID=85310 RepID=A0A9P0MQN9_NEZVI|nr:unnamed protein product [Nezara viridula]
MDTGKETPLEWNTSEISASTSVFDITQNQTEELNYTVMSELTFGSNLNRASNSTVPTQESIIADTLAAWEHEEFAPENITTSEKLSKNNTSKSKGNGRKRKQSILQNESFLSGSSENSINYSSIQSAVLLPKAASQVGNDFNRQVLLNSSHNNTNLNSSSESGGTNSTFESQLNSTYITSQNSSLVSDSSSNQTVGELEASMISSTQTARRKKVGNITLPTLPEEGKGKILNVPPKQEVKKRAPKGATKTKTKGTQVNIKTKAPKKNVAPKKTTGTKVVRKKMEGNKKQENVEHTEASIRENIIPENNLNVNIGIPCDYETNSKEALLKEKVEELLNMPSTSHGVSDINNTIEAVDHTIGSVDFDQSESEVLVSQSCSIEIVKDANRASKINITLPPETNLSLSKKKAATVKSKKSLPSNKVKKDSLTGGSNNIPNQGKIKIKQEKSSPNSIDLTLEAKPNKIKHEKLEMENKKKHSRKNETSKPENKKHGKASPAPKNKKQTIACGYMSSDSSDESDESYDSSGDDSTSCSCSDCEHYCGCTWCGESSSCSCSSSSESSYESPRRRRHHR